MLDMISNFLAMTKDVVGGVELPDMNASPSTRTQTTAASASSYSQKKPNNVSPNKKPTSYDPYSNKKTNLPGAAVSSTSTG